MLKAFSILRYLSFVTDFFDYVQKQLDKEAKVNFKIYDVTYWTTNNYNPHIPQYINIPISQVKKLILSKIIEKMW